MCPYCLHKQCGNWMMPTLLVLDPRISYKGIKADYADDSILSDHLEQSRSNLIDYFNTNYSNTIPVLSLSPLCLLCMSNLQILHLWHVAHPKNHSLVGWMMSSAPKFILHSLRHCVFLVSHQSYTGLIFNVSLGSAVAVKRIFLGGHDTISLRHPSLHAETIHIFMLIKKQLHLARAQANASLHR